MSHSSIKTQFGLHITEHFGKTKSEIVSLDTCYLPQWTQVLWSDEWEVELFFYFPYILYVHVCLHVSINHCTYFLIS